MVTGSYDKTAHIRDGDPATTWNKDLGLLGGHIRPLLASNDKTKHATALAWCRKAAADTKRQNKEILRLLDEALRVNGMPAAAPGKKEKYGGNGKTPPDEKPKAESIGKF